MLKKITVRTFCVVGFFAVFYVLNVIRYSSQRMLSHHFDGSDDVVTFVLALMSAVIVYLAYRLALVTTVFIGHHWKFLFKLVIACGVSAGAYHLLMVAVVMGIPALALLTVGGWHPVPPMISVSVCATISVWMGYEVYRGLTKLFLRGWSSKPRIA